jgi:hypothetical protein
LAESALGKQANNALGARDIELGEWIVKKDERRATAAIVQRRSLEQPERDRGRPLLAGRAEDPQLALRPIGSRDRDE